MTYLQFIKEKEKYVSKNKKEVYAVKWLLLNSSYYPGFNNLNNQIPEEDLKALNKYIDKYVLENIPPQYILNKAFFYGYEFYVDSGCFIPRNETEQLVEQTIYRIDDRFADKKIEIADVCTGSGIIGISLKKEIKNCNVLMCDISNDALKIALKNAEINKADVTIVQGDFINPIIGKKFDVIVCNPPYIKNDEKLDTLVVDNEPNIALFGGNDGLHFYRIILSEFENLIKENGFMSFEIGYDLKEGLTNLLKELLPNRKFEFLQDYNGKDRMLFVYKD